MQEEVVSTITKIVFEWCSRGKMKILHSWSMLWPIFFKPLTSSRSAWSKGKETARIWYVIKVTEFHLMWAGGYYKTVENRLLISRAQILHFIEFTSRNLSQNFDWLEVIFIELWPHMETLVILFGTKGNNMLWHIHIMKFIQKPKSMYLKAIYQHRKIVLLM